MIERADLDNDGLISEEEFYAIMTRRSLKAWSASFIRGLNTYKGQIEPDDVETIKNFSRKIIHKEFKVAPPCLQVIMV
jgi:Ca2+-binding EF-hand superfamily protein